MRCANAFRACVAAAGLHTAVGWMAGAEARRANAASMVSSPGPFAAGIPLAPDAADVRFSEARPPRGGVPGAQASLAGGARAARAETAVNVFFGNGCFWHVQHEVVKKEVGALGRDGSSITALSGYAGGTQVGSKGRVCYHNRQAAPDYGQMGHTEVVNVSFPEGKVGEFARAYFDSASSYVFGRTDPQDMGPEYRSAIGLPGGMDGPLFKQVEVANAGRMELLRGKGNDDDTVGTKKVWIYNSDEFPFYQGEVYHQFHDDMLERYSERYHSLKRAMQDRGTLKEVGCPEPPPR